MIERQKLFDESVTHVQRFWSCFGPSTACRAHRIARRIRIESPALTVENNCRVFVIGMIAVETERRGRSIRSNPVNGVSTLLLFLCMLLELVLFENLLLSILFFFFLTLTFFIFAVLFLTLTSCFFLNLEAFGFLLCFALQRLLHNHFSLLVH